MAKRMLLELPDNLCDLLEQRNKETGIPRTSLVKLALSQYFDENDREPRQATE